MKPVPFVIDSCYQCIVIVLSDPFTPNFKCNHSNKEFEKDIEDWQYPSYTL
jgi:hypothetical protein